MIDWRGIREFVRSEWMLWGFFIPTSVAPFAVLLWGWLGDLWLAIVGNKFWNLATGTERGAGVMLGIIGGFATLTAGHMINAWLTRRRDDRLRESEIRALAGALAAEAFSMVNGLNVLTIQVDNLGNGHAVAVEDLWRPPFSVFHGNIHRIGQLGGTLDAEVVDIVHSVSETGRRVAINRDSIHGDREKLEEAKEDIAYAIEQLGILRGRLDERTKGRTPVPVPLPEAPKYDPPHPPTPE